MTQPLRRVVDRGPYEDQPGWRDRLECGHEVPFNGDRVVSRRCPECPDVPVEQPPLLGDLWGWWDR